jgi:hypothetical protein
MIENSKLSIGGNSGLVFLGEQLNELGKVLLNMGEKIITNNKTKYVTNPSAVLINPFILLINFTVDVSDKYQIVLQGDYKKNYKDSYEGNINLSEAELFMIIKTNKPLWFKKY